MDHLAKLSRHLAMAHKLPGIVMVPLVRPNRFWLMASIASLLARELSIRLWYSEQSPHRVQAQPTQRVILS